jgi:small-conductance mechanosensitive channel
LQTNGPNAALELFGVELVGVTPENGRKLLITLAFILIVWLVNRFSVALIRAVINQNRWPRAAFWSRQLAMLITALILFVGVISVWFDDPTRLATALGLVTAGLAFALQRVITAIAGYFVILRGNIFNVGDRIVMGGVRGDVVALGFMQTAIMEMGQPKSVQDADPAMWVKGRQYTGRMVSVSNARIFDEPVYNYTRDFELLFEEMTVPIPYRADRAKAEAILLETARRHTRELREIGEREARELQRRYFLNRPSFEPKVYYTMTDNWLELALRFVAPAHGIRELKDAMTREILSAFDAGGIEIASATFEVTRMPRVNLSADRPSRDLLNPAAQ